MVGICCKKVAAEGEWLEFDVKELELGCAELAGRYALTTEALRTLRGTKK